MLSLVLFASSALALDLQAPTGLKQGHPATFGITGGTPGQTVGLVYGGAPPGACPPVLGGLCLAVSAPVVVDTAVVRADGTAVLAASVPANAPLVDVRFQAAEIGASPSVSPVRTVPVLTRTLSALTVTDTASLETARHVWSAMGLTLGAGAYPSVLSLPIEEVGWVFVTDASRDLTLPALTATSDVFVGRTDGARVTAPVWTNLRGAGGSIQTEDNTGPVVVSAPSLPTLGYVQLVGDTAEITISAPSLTSAPSFNVQREGGDLSEVLPTLTDATSVDLTGMTVTELTFLPSLERAAGLTLMENPGLVRVARLGAAGIVVANGATINGNLQLTDLAGWSPSAVGTGSCDHNVALPSCACAAWLVTAPLAQCIGNAPDTCSDDAFDLCSL